MGQQGQKGQPGHSVGPLSPLDRGPTAGAICCQGQLPATNSLYHNFTVLGLPFFMAAVEIKVKV